MGRDKLAPLSAELESNLAVLLDALNRFRAVYGKPMHVTSGYRPPTINANTPGASKNSAHQVCLAADFADTGHELSNFCLANLPLLEACGLYMEDPAHTIGWVHLQARPPKSGRRIFIP